MDIQAINLADKLSTFDEYWSPRIIAQMNDYHFKLAKIRGEFIWHSHPETDEVFLVLKGDMRIEFRGFHTELSEGEMCVVPRGIEHKPVAQDVCQIMLIEPTGTLNTGDAGGERTKTDENWI
ncbi:MAG: cupin [Anaerolineae bacterium SM23_ 63]|nr:MAG: cupin [Anaerolineae bacterium SM23_ 63]HEY45522.1 cupin domain-containing protein [Anaerolineae bacterium]